MNDRSIRILDGAMRRRCYVEAFARVIREAHSVPALDALRAAGFTNQEITEFWRII
jgi:alkylhydroperoxidase family enzyme